MWSQSVIVAKDVIVNSSAFQAFMPGGRLMLGIAGFPLNESPRVLYTNH